MTEDIREVDRRAVELSVRIVDATSIADLDRPTPCAGWDLGQLLEHMAAQHHGFARAAIGMRTTVEDWRPRFLGGDPAAAYIAAAGDVVLAFADSAVPDRELWVPEIRPDAPLPWQVAVAAHALDYVAHSWDVAAAVGVDPDIPDDLIEAVLPMAERIPDTPAARGPDRAFAPALAVADAAPARHRFLARIGRDPAWRP